MIHINRSLCPGCVPFPTFGKKKGYIDKYGPKTPNSTKIQAFMCQNVLTRTQINPCNFFFVKG